MRILHCIPTLGGGGSERRLSYLVGELARTGHEVHVAYISDGANSTRLGKGPVIHHRLDRGYKYGPGVLIQLVGLIKRIQPDIVQTWLTQMDLLGGMSARVLRKPFILTEPSCERAYPPTIKNVARACVARFAEAIVSNSAGGDDYWKDHAPKVSRYIVRNALPLDEMQKDGRRPAVDTGSRKVVLHVGRLIPEKNVSNLVRACASIMEDFVAVFCGEGPERAVIEQEGKAAGVSGRLLLHGYTDNVWEYMKRADVFVSVSDFEGCPNSVLEAMAFGCPIVVSDIPAHREFLDDECAFFVNPHSPDDIGQALNYCLSNPHEARQRGLRAREKTDKWTIAAMTSGYTTVYESVLSRNGRSPAKISTHREM